MKTYLLELTKIEETGSIGRQLKVSVTANDKVTTINTTGKSSRTHRLLTDQPFQAGKTVVTVKVQVSEADAKVSDQPFSAASSITVDPLGNRKQAYGPLQVELKELGGKGKNKDKAATLSFTFQTVLNYSISAAGIDFLTAHEIVGNVIPKKAYLDKAKKWTIGIGHKIVLPAEQELMTKTITDAEAKAILRKDVAKAEDAVNKLVAINLTQNQFDALVSFAFNVGVSEKGFGGSTLLKKINAGASEAEIRAEFARWNKIGTTSDPGLSKRRADEADYYFNK